MSGTVPENCEACGASIRGYANVLALKGKYLCDEYLIKAFDPNGLLKTPGGVCKECGTPLDQKGKALSQTGELICLGCLEKDRVANWWRRKLPDVPDKCEKCDASLVGNDVAMLWLGKALCGRCFDEIRKAHPEINKFALLPLVDLGWTNELGSTPKSLTVHELQPTGGAVVEIEDADFFSKNEDPDKYIN